MPEEWKKGLEFFKKSSGFAKALKEIQDNPAYKGLTQEQKESEAMNTILGRMGEGYFSSDMLTKFKNWFTQLLKKVADKLNLRKLTPDEKFESFANKVLGDLFGGKDITEKQEVEKGDLQLMAVPKEDFTEALNEYDNLIKNPKGTTEYIKKFGLEKIKKIKDITSNFGTYIAALEKSNYITKKIC
jgi:hypothetical protein